MLKYLVQAYCMMSLIQQAVALPPLDKGRDQSRDQNLSQQKNEDLWRPLNVKHWVSKQPVLRLRPVTRLWAKISASSPSRIRLGEIELPSHKDFTQLWTRLTRYPRDLNQVMIVGDSLSATDHYLRCFKDRLPYPKDESNIKNLVIKRWRSQGASSVLERDSYATQPGATSWRLTRARSLKRTKTYGENRVQRSDLPHILMTPLLREAYEHPARFAVVLLGTNDLRYHRGVERFSAHYLQIVETLLDVGILPILYTIPPQTEARGKQKSQVSTFNQIIRTIAASERLPLVHFHQALLKLKTRGLRVDGIHLNAYQGGCNLKPRGLRFGQNIRNYLTLEALSQIKRHLRLTPSNQHQCHYSNPQEIRYPDPFRSSRLKTTKRDQRSKRSKRSKKQITHQRLSVVSPSSPIITAQDLCWRHVTKRARRSSRWRLLRPRPTKSVGPPLKEYGTWRGLHHEIMMHRESKLNFLTLGSLGHKPDLSREQFWVYTADKNCLRLSEISQELHLPKGQNKLLHYVRFDDPTDGSTDGSTEEFTEESTDSRRSEKTPDDLMSRVVFSWE